MAKRLLVAVDDTDASRRAVRYVGFLAGLIDDLHTTLLHVPPEATPFAADAAARGRPQDGSGLKPLEDAQADASAAVLQPFHKKLEETGVRADRIQAVSRPAKGGVAKTILDYGYENRCDAIVAGRRGLSAIKTAFLGSVSAALFEHAFALPIWIVGSETPNPRFLVAVDSSEGSLRAVEHVAQVFQGNAHLIFHLFHVIPSLTESCGIDFGHEPKRLEREGRRGVRHCIDHFCAKATALFEAAGLRADQIDIEVTERLLNPGRGIVDEIERGAYGTVVMGRRGMSRSFFTGSVSRYVMERTAETTLWLVP